MNITLDDDNQIAFVYDFDESDWTTESATIPEAYTIEFHPGVDGNVLDSLNTGRAINYKTVTRYVNQVFGKGFVAVPQIYQVQQLLPLPETDTTTDSSNS